MGRQKKGQPLNGWLVLDKPLSMTSTQALGKARWCLDGRKAGHAGTLDPLATGLLCIAFGEATKCVDHLMGRAKTYRFTLCFGQATSTDDREGAITATSDVRPDDAAIMAAFAPFLGDIQQVPPVYSAIRVDGERAYDLARDGNAPVLQARTVWVGALTLVARPDADHAVIEMTCGKGAYVRSLARDLAVALGTVGHVADLRRIATGPFTEADAISLETLEQLRHKGAAAADLAAVHLRPVATVLDDIPALALTGPAAALVRNGGPASAAGLAPADADEVLATCDGQALALGTIRSGLFEPKRVFNL